MNEHYNIFEDNIPAHLKEKHRLSQEITNIEMASCRSCKADCKFCPLKDAKDFIEILRGSHGRSSSYGNRSHKNIVGRAN